MSTILVTGARGTVGGYVVALAETAGHRVIASDRSARGVRVPVLGEVRPGDLREPGVAARLVAGCDVVVHTAAQLDVAATPSELSGTNTDAVIQLYEAAAAAGVERFVHLSTATLYGPGEPDGEGIREDAALMPRGPYGLSKFGAEAYLRGLGNLTSGPAWTILRPAPIYGRRGRHFAASLLAIAPLMRLISPVLPRSHGGPRSTMVHAEDVARAILFVLERSETRFEIYNVADGDPLPLADRIGITFDAYGLQSVDTGATSRRGFEILGKLCQRTGPYQLADAISLFGWRLLVARHGLKQALRPRMDREAMRLLYEDLVVDASKLRALGWEPSVPRFEQGFRQVLRWYQAERWVPRYA